MKDQSATPPGRGGNGARGRSTAAVVIFLVLIVAGAAMAGWYIIDRLTADSYDDYQGEGSGSVIVSVAPGDTVTVIAGTLADADVVASAQAFIAATQDDERATSIAPGAYDMRLQMSGEAAFERILDPAARYETQVVLPEGLRIDQTVQRTSDATGIPAEALWAVLRDPAQGLQLPTWAPATGDLRAEGFLFPATYAIAKDATALAVLQSYVDRFNKASAASGLEEAESKVGYSPYEVLTIASLIQAEGDPDDYAKVARVIYNRLDPDTWGETYGKLQLDATINYANAEANLNLSSEQLQQDGPYNTYTREGLPPTPINSPGEEAIVAALNPADGDWLYYVTVNPDTGETKFTSSYQEFLNYKAQFETWCKDNPGKC
jgi:UPF0755 protein